MRLLLFTCFALSVAACTSPKDQRGLEPFAGDGCSLFPDQSLTSRARWCTCCLRHDVAYWRGGTEAQRKAADEALLGCVSDKAQDDALAKFMYEAVRVGGSPYFPQWYRWGYGWPFERMYEPLTQAELEQVMQRWSEFEHSDRATECADAPRPSELRYIVDPAAESG